MSPVWSGGIVYEWIQEENDYGLVTLGPGGTPTPLPDFSYLGSRWASATPVSTPIKQYTPTNTFPSCPVNTAGGFQGQGKVAPIPSNDGTGWQGGPAALAIAPLPSSSTSSPVPSLASRTSASPSRSGISVATSGISAISSARTTAGGSEAGRSTTLSPATGSSTSVGTSVTSTAAVATSLATITASASPATTSKSGAFAGFTALPSFLVFLISVSTSFVVLVVCM